MTGQRALTHYALDETQTIYDRVGENTGNMAFITAICDSIDADVSLAGWDSSPKILSAVDVVVFPCANQFAAHTDLGYMGDLLLEAGRPVVAIGLGAQASDRSGDAQPTSGTVHWLQVIQKLRSGSAPNILVRGEYTMGQLAQHNILSTEVIGCPSLFLSRRTDLGASVAAKVTIGEPARIATIAGNSSWTHLAHVDQLMVSLAASSVQGLPWVLQEEMPLIELARGREISVATLKRLTDHFAPKLAPEIFAQWVRSNAAVFFDIESWMEHMQRFDACVGPRFHGAMLAMQAGTIGAVIAHDSRTSELCETTGLPSVAEDEIRRRGAGVVWETLASFSGQAFDVRRRELAATYCSLLEQNGLKVTGVLKQLTLDDHGSVEVGTQS